jgi:hypothetical protein
VVEAAQNWSGADTPVALYGTGERALEAQAAVWPVAVVILGELGQHGPEVPLVEHDQVVEALRPDGPHHPLRDGIGVGRLGRRPDADDPEVFGSGAKVGAVDGISVVDEIPGLPTPGGL